MPKLKSMKKEDVMEFLAPLSEATKPGRTNDGSRIHVR